MHNAYLGLGSNLGNKCENVAQAIELLQAYPDISVVDVSSFYETEPVGYRDQDSFMNCVIRINTTLAPYELLNRCHEVEKSLKRERTIRWGPRTIDVDILLYDALHLEDSELTIPHPRMQERAFVLIPLYELDKHIMIEGKPLENLLNTVCPRGIRKIEPHEYPKPGRFLKKVI